VALAPIGYALTLPEPQRSAGAAPVVAPMTAKPTWSGPPPVARPAALPDGTAYTPRLYLGADDSVGVAPTPDRSAVRVLARTGDRVTELHRVAATEGPQFDAFVATGDTVVWAMTSGASQRTGLWRSNWRTGARATQVVANIGDVSFTGGAFDLVLGGGRVSWATDSGTGTDVKSVALTGGQIATKKLAGQYVLTVPPFAVNLDGGRGQPVQLIDLSTDQRLSVPTASAEIASCDPHLCRLGVINDNVLVRLDVQRPDGSQRRRVAGNEATPITTEVALIDRWVPLKTDAGGGQGTGLSLHDLTTGRTELVATDVANAQGRGAMLWWSDADTTTWYALDLRTLA
jgi:hypothetical protein